MSQPKPPARLPVPRSRPVPLAPPPRPPAPPANVIPFNRAWTARTLAQGWGTSGSAAPARAPVPPPEPPEPAEPTQVDPTMVMRLPPVMDPAEPEPEPAPAPARPPTPAPAVAAPTGADRWAVFEELGLGPPTRAAQKKNTQKLLVDLYRLLGFAILSIIVLVLVGYISQSIFYFVSDSWIQPMMVSRTDERVVNLETQLAEQENERDRILADINQADRAIAVQQAFQAEFAAAIRADLSGRRAALDRARDMARDYAGARARIEKSNKAYAAASRKKMSQEYAAGLIDRGGLLSGKYQLAQITTNNLSLVEREMEYELRATELETEARALEAILSETGGDAALSYDVLRIKQEFERSRLETAKAIEDRSVLKAALERQESIIAGLERSPYLRAVRDGTHVAFVPYGNLDGVRPGVPLYGCKLEFVGCSRVGKVIEVVPGEVAFKHPHRDKVLRGQMVEVELTDRGAAEDDVLFVGDKPLGF
jgi:hypothetical protein